MTSAPEKPEISPADAAEQVFRKAGRHAVIAYLVIAVLALPLGYLLAKGPGLWGAGLGLAIGIFFSGLTILSMILTAKSSPLTMMGTIMGIWLGKMVVLVIVLAVLGEREFYDRNIFAVVLLVAVVASLWADVLAVQRGRILNVETTLPSPDADQ